MGGLSDVVWISGWWGSLGVYPLVGPLLIHRVYAICQVYPATVIHFFESPTLDRGLVFGKPFPLYHRIPFPTALVWIDLDWETGTPPAQLGS